jgi:hypothetical protein
VAKKALGFCRVTNRLHLWPGQLLPPHRHSLPDDQCDAKEALHGESVVRDEAAKSSAF